MKYTPIRSKEEFDELCYQIEHLDFVGNPVASDFLKIEGRRIYGVLHDAHGFDKGSFIIFGQTIQPDKIKAAPSNTIFDKLKLYGSSCQYKGLLNTKGDILIENNYNELTLCNGNRLIAYRKDYCTLFHLDGTEIKGTRYERIFEAGENTYGFKHNGLIGFLNQNGEVVINPEYQDKKGYNLFVNGYATVLKDLKNSEYRFKIDHYGLIVESECIEYYNEVQSEHNLGTGYYPHGNLPDALDAYDGDEGNRWNTD